MPEAKPSLVTETSEVERTCPDCERLTLALEDALEAMASVSMELAEDQRWIAPMNDRAARAVADYIRIVREGRNREVERRNNAILRGAR